MNNNNNTLTTQQKRLKALEKARQAKKLKAQRKQKAKEARALKQTKPVSEKKLLALQKARAVKKEKYEKQIKELKKKLALEKKKITNEKKKLALIKARQAKALKREQKQNHKINPKHIKHVTKKEEKDNTYYINARLTKTKRLFKGNFIESNYAVRAKNEAVPITETTIATIAKKIMELIGKTLDEVKNELKDGGYSLFVKLYKHGGEIDASNVFRGDNITEDEVYAKLEKTAREHYNNNDYLLFLENVFIAVVKRGTTGGCEKGDKIKKIYVDKNTNIKLRSIRSTQNNCLIACFLNAYGVSGNTVKPIHVRNALGLLQNEKIDIDVVEKMSEWFNTKTGQNKGYVLINEQQQILKQSISTSTEKEQDCVQLCLYNEHYYLYDEVKHEKCNTCGQTYNVEDEHRCNPSVTTWWRRRVMKKYDTVYCRRPNEEEFDYTNFISFDLETWQDGEEDRHVPYASAWMQNGVYSVEYGKNCFQKTVDEFVKMENKTISAYCGSKFDFHFLVDYLTLIGVCPQNIKKNGDGKIMYFTFGSNKIFDLYLFIGESLEKACDSFKLDSQKSKFDHKLIKSWEDVQKYKNEVLPYLKKDVECLNELFTTFNKLIYEKVGCNTTSYYSISHQAYTIWSSKLNSVVEILKDENKYNIASSATYGARTYPNQQKFQSKYYDDVVKGKMTYEELKKTNEFLFNADVSSMYSSSMVNTDIMNGVRYPCGFSKWSTKQKEMYEKGMLGIYYIKFSCPKNIRNPILPRKKKIGDQLLGCQWSLTDGEGWYTSVDIDNAMESGYTINFVEGKECLIWEESTTDLFSSYVDLFYTMKTQAEQEKNPVLRAIAKLFLNSLYGKLMQKKTYADTIIIDSAEKWDEFAINKNIIGYEIINKDKIMLTGEDKNEKNKINKPNYLGAFVLSYTRRLMMQYMKTIDPTLKEMIFTYGDTDSMHIHGQHYHKLNELGLIKSKTNSKLGYMSNDTKNDGLIIREICIAPKCYMYEYIDKDGQIHTSNDAVVKGKGLPSNGKMESNFNHSMFEDLEHDATIKFTSLQTKNFSIVEKQMSRTLAKHWEGFTLIDNHFYPPGYIHE